MSKTNWHGRGTNTERGYGYAWRKTRALILRIDNHLCQVCLAKGRPTPATEVDHILAKHKGGTDEADNLQAICRSCHQAKTQAEAAEANGQVYRPKVTIGRDGWPVE